MTILHSKKRLSLAKLLTIILLTSPALMDFPIHCIEAQIEGKWELHLTKPSHIHSQKKARCGYPTPGNAGEAWRHTPNDDFHSYSTMKVLLKQDDMEMNKAYRLNKEGQKTDEHTGFWTMIYDEGIEIRVSGHSFFTWFQYNKKGSDSISYCDKSLIGFYTVGNKRGCFYMTQTSKLEKEIGSVSHGNKIKGIEGHPVIKKPSKFIDEQK